MRNLALQGEVRHVLPTLNTNDGAVVNDDNGNGQQAGGAVSENTIVAVIQNANSDLIHNNFDSHYASDAVDNNSNNSSSNGLVSNSTQPPVSFVVTSEGKLIALDVNDRLVWVVDLEKVVEDSNDEEDDDDDGDVIDVDIGNDISDNGTKPRSTWFYASSFLQENSPEDDDDNANNDNNNNTNGNADTIMGMNLGSEGSLHITCLSRAGHVVSVSIDETTSIIASSSSSSSSKGGGGVVVEEGSECIGSFENGLECGGWSPDGEVLALVTFASDDDDDEDDDDDRNEIVNNDAQVGGDDAKVPILMTMNTQYEILSEVRLDPCLFATHSDSNDNISSIHPNAISLCWRPDSSSLALSTMDATTTTTTTTNAANNVTKNVTTNSKPLRRIRTYHRTTLQLLSLSKEEDGSGRDVPNLLPTTPTWAPAGCSHYVGTIQSSRPLNLNTKSSRRQAGRMQVAFMEPNGLRHRECKIHSTVGGKMEKEDVMGVAFNLEGDLLAVTSKVTSKNGVSSNKEQHEYGKVQFYHRSNYHWYLKYELRYDGNAGSSSPAVVSAVKFSDEDPYKITVALDCQQEDDGALEWREYTFRWESSTVYYRNHTSSTSLASSSSSVLAMAIDGKKLNFTPFDKAIIPPPMCAASLDLPAPVVGVAARPSFYNEVAGEEGRVEFIIALSDGKLALLQSGGSGVKTGSSMTPGFQPPSLLAIVDPFNITASDETVDGGFTLRGMTLRDITIIDADDNSLTVIAVSCPKATEGKHHFIDHLIEMKITHNTPTSSGEGAVTTTSDIVVASFLPLEERALRIVNWSDTAHSAGARGGALLQLADGTTLEYSQGGVLEPCDAAGPLLEACPWIAGVYDATSDATPTTSPKTTDDHNLHGDDDDETPKRLVIGLSSRYRLYCGERLLSSASSSFFISLEHRFITHVTIGSRPQLRFLSLASLRDFDPLMGSDENMALDGYEPRSVERGARLVAIFPTKPMAIIQMPRGNLENISPRALVLPFVMMKIQAGDFLTALDIMRRQRVDMNLLVDLDPISFLEEGGAEKFIGQIQNINNINLFLSSLIDVDTTLWKYPVPSWIRTEQIMRAAPRQITEGLSKVNKVCIKVRDVMLSAEKHGVTASGKIVKERHFLLPTLSTFAKENPPKLEEALTLIKNSAQGEHSKQSKRKSILLSEHVQSSIQYLAFLADYELIFNTAIGMYDFDLAKAVARHSQMDPKVYLPMLKRWRELPEDTARYEVDVKLKRYESALRHLVAAGQVAEELAMEDHFEKCLKFIKEHGLHKLGLELFKDDKTNCRSIMVSLGEHLLLERKPEEALAIFLAANPRHLDGGKRASRSCGDWRAYFACCAEDGETVDDDTITAIAESISSKVCNMREQRDNYASAASILLDYGEDVAYAIDMLVSAHLWSEGRRIAHLHERIDLVKKVVDGSASYARTCIEDLAERASTFVKTIERYAEVIVIRRDAIREAEEAGILDTHLDDSASMFSMQSTASNTSLRSTASGSSVGSVGSVGSVASVSTVISVGATSTFSFTGEVDLLKHNSKFNNLGKKKKKKKSRKKGSAARRTKPGSEEELKELVTALVHGCPDEHYVAVISETVTFLLQCDKLSMATLLFESYKELSEAVAQSQSARLGRDKEEKEEREKRERKEGRFNDFVEHPCEKDINAIICKPLQGCVQSTFSFLL